MKRLGSVVLAVLLWGQFVHAHNRPPRRGVIVQTETERVGVMVVWTLEDGPLSVLLPVYSALVSRGEDGLERIARLGAVRNLSFWWNGTQVSHRSAKVRVVPPRGQGKHWSVLLLFEFPLGDGEQTLEVHPAGSDIMTHIRWNPAGGKWGSCVGEKWKALSQVELFRHGGPLNCQ